MLDILLIIFFSYQLFKYAKRAGLTAWKWAVAGAFAWIFAELLGAMLFIVVAGIDVEELQGVQDTMEIPEALQGSIVLMYLFMWGCGYLSYLLVRKRLFQSAPEGDDEEE